MVIKDGRRLMCTSCASFSCGHVQEHIKNHSDTPLVSDVENRVDVLIFERVVLPYSKHHPSLSVPIQLVWNDDPRENKNATATWTLARAKSDMQEIGGIVTPFEGRRVIRTELFNAFGWRIAGTLYSPWGCKLKQHDSARNVRLYKNDRRYAIADTMFRYVHGVCLMCHEYGQGGVQGL